MGKGITDKQEQVTYMKERLNMFLEVLDAIEPENTELEDIDRLIAMVDELDEKMQQFNVTPVDEKQE
ncbi:SE1561 family protein [Planomicrobium sp. CPCC 101079]|uniref:SE1561 family protein n=1 Tax=Planomicrobium sp. CPCC 101079 TaxID=2599618 RepID=UPI0011B50628|nr:SE1561 family protein [Planomicrobium sp. CPCC 101079]TWT13445.1 hypothetical protein FQV28_01930 [Planomicrobium sp. CPCC 101079]